MEKSMSTFYSHATTTILTILLILATTTSSTNPTSSPLHFSKSSRSSSSSPSRSSPSVSNPEKLFDDTIQSILTQLAQSTSTMASLVTTSTSSQGFTEDPEITSTTTGPVGDCMDLLDDTLDQLSNVAHRRHNPAHTHDDVQTWLSAALTNQETCKESLQTPPLKNPHRHHEPAMKAMLLQSLARNMTATVEASLALYVNHINTNNSPRHVMSPKYRKYPSNNIPGGRKLLSASSSFPGWLPAAKRKLLEASVDELEVHAVVAKDGSGTHTTVAAALRAVMMSGGATVASGGGSSVIYIKAGTYKETLNIPTKQKNVVLMGDGKGKTVIVGSKNADDGSTTYQTATVAAMGDGFMARDITIINDAGPTKHQAVALRVGSDRSVIFRCSIQGYQDTLYALSKRQFYRETDVYGTIDFIFGNAAAVFQSCSLFARKGGSYPNNFVTAQGRSSEYQNTGFSIHNCRVEAAPDLPAGSGSTYLGRPWKEYSRTVVMQSQLGGHINPAGWSAWSGGFALKTLYYAEYLNSGPGAGTSGRVGWPGYHSALAPTDAGKFTVGQFIAGNSWLPSTGVSFDSGLIG
ncbi:unnamed protein product [Linum tenue]|uniref:Pectinesterase n=1 Tax=Linum tenue TaxID=586396 RepID=A0AAV0IJD9_9ROSI|nr:unnamed protein product [Linum tenue]